MDAGEKKGTFEVHVHETPNQPVLVSRKALKALAAIIDFEKNQVVYRSINDRMVVPLKPEWPPSHSIDWPFDVGTMRKTSLHGLLYE